MRHLSAYVLVIASLMGLSSVAVACMWDYDTIRMERTRFPGTLELITGKFLRHSPEFYQWRIANRLKRLETDPTNVAWLDDLAVAYDKTGQHDKAIATAITTEKRKPGRYETAANLGTFYFHAGKLEEGLPHIDRALKINPNAHFGREKYQKLLVEYVIERRKGGPLKLPLANVDVSENRVRESKSAHEVTIGSTFEEFLCVKIQHERHKPEIIAEAIKGVTGMMKFGKHDSPVLLEVLGTLLPERLKPQTDAKLLAVRAFLKASYDVPEGPTRVAYRGMAANALYMQTPRDATAQISLERVEADFQKELTEAEAWYAALHERELSWIRDGKDLEAEFDKLYETEPEVSGMDATDPPEMWKTKVRVTIIVVIAVAILIGGLFLLVKLVRRIF